MGQGIHEVLATGTCPSTVAAFAADCKSVSRLQVEATGFGVVSLLVWWCRVLEENMVATVEPGCYFNPFLLQPAFEDSRQSPFLNKRRLEASLAS